jgi:putative transposase
LRAFAPTPGAVICRRCSFSCTIDGAYVGDDHALGLDAQGNKRVLGVREGATENATSCTARLTDIRERGLLADRAILAGIDGAKALTKAIGDCSARAR